MVTNYIRNFDQFVNEKVSPPDGIYRSDWLFKEMQKGNKDVMFLVLEHPRVDCTEDINILEKARELGYGELKVDKKDGEAVIIYVPTERGEKNAKRLLQIANSHDGYLADKTAEEAREIGKLLDYDDFDIDNYVKKNYGDGKHTSFQQGEEETD